MPVADPPLRLALLPGVFRPPGDCRLLARVIRERDVAAGRTVLDLCTGSGALALAAAREGAAHVTAIDTSRRAVLTTRRNARRNGLDVEVLRGDLFGPVAARRFDLIVTNPPYLPGPQDPPHGAARACESGPDGRWLVDRICARAAEHLTADGTLLVTRSSPTGEQETLAQLAAAGLWARVVARQPDPLASGALDPGGSHEDIIVVAASRRGGP